jgi:hypothetical protein
MNPMGGRAVDQKRMTSMRHTRDNCPNLLEGVALRLFAAAHAKAEEFRCPPWQQAVPMQALRSAGIPHGVLQQLVDQGQIEFALEDTPDSTRGRSFRPVRELSFPDNMCFVLTAAGVTTARQVSFPWENSHRESTVGLVFDDEGPARVDLPAWHREFQELRVGQWVVKRFKRPATDQVAILDAFEEEGWPRHLDDPLPPRQGQNPKGRLHDTIKRLNRGQRPRMIRFMGNGLGTGILWTWI